MKGWVSRKGPKVQFKQQGLNESGVGEAQELKIAQPEPREGGEYDHGVNCVLCDKRKRPSLIAIHRSLTLCSFSVRK